MPRKKRHDEDLPPAILSELLFREIDAVLTTALGAMNQPTVTWTASFGDASLEESTIEPWFELIKKEKTKIDEITIQVFDKDETQFELNCVHTGSGTYYDCLDRLEGDLSRLVRSIAGIFGAHTRWTASVPISRPHRLMNSPKFELGRQSRPIWRRLHWERITENVVTNVVSHLVVGGITLVLGLLIGGLLGGLFF